LHDRPRRARIILAVLLLASVTVITVDFRESASGPVDRLRQVTVGVFGPAQRAVSAVTRPVGASTLTIALRMTTPRHCAPGW